MNNSKNMAFKYGKYLLSLGLILASFVSVYAQQKELDLAEEYYRNKEYKKALSIYDKYIKNDNFLSDIHSPYLEALYQTNEERTANRYLRKLVKKYPQNATYNTDYGKHLIQYEDSTAAKEHLEDYLKIIDGDDTQLRYAAVHFKDARMFENAEKAYQLARENGNNDLYYEMAELYLMWGKTEEMIDEYIQQLLVDKQQLDYVQIAIQDNIDDKEANLLERKLITVIQKYPNRLVLNEMLLWFYLQRKEFYKAFMQARAIDKRKRMNGDKIMTIGYMALNNDAYKDAERIFTYVVKQYAKNRVTYNRARRMLIYSKAELVKNAYPVDKKKIESLVSDYREMIEEAGLGRETAEAARNMARLQAFYLNNKDTAVQILEQLIKMPMLPMKTISKAKLDLGDIYLLKEEPWEATLLYSQVEKTEKEKKLGHQAKLKNAKLHFYKGDFQLAKSHLDILKLATSREIANDAMDLSLLIEDNFDLDTTEVTMREYSQIDLLVFQGKYEEALEGYNTMLTKYPKHKLIDEVLWERANINIKLGRFEDALKDLEKLLEAFNEDILADDANFFMGKIYEEYLDKPEKAMEYYRKQLTDFKGSVHNVEARKRFRQLRGDKI